MKPQIKAGIAQLGERQTEDLKVACSIHAHRTRFVRLGSNGSQAFSFFFSITKPAGPKYKPSISFSFSFFLYYEAWAGSKSKSNISFSFSITIFALLGFWLNMCNPVWVLEWHQKKKKNSTATITYKTSWMHSVTEFWNPDQTTASVQLASALDSIPSSSSHDAFRYPIVAIGFKNVWWLMASTKLGTTQHTAQCKVICQRYPSRMSPTQKTCPSDWVQFIIITIDPYSFYNTGHAKHRSIRSGSQQ